MNNRRTFFIALTFLAAIIACIVPGLPTASAPAPILDTGRLETMVAETVSAAIAQTEQSRPTPTWVPAAEPTQTQTATAEAATIGSTLSIQEDGSTVFVDERAGYAITLPDGWLAVRINEQEYYDAWTLAEAADPNIQEALLGIKTGDPNVLRLLAIDTQDGHIQSEFVTDINFIWDEPKNISFDSIEDLQAIAEELPNTPAAFRFEVTTIQIIMSPNGIQFGVIEAKSSFTNTSGDEVGIYQKQVFFKGKTGTQSIIFTTVDGLKETTLPAFDSMLETIKLNQ
jgi:hypothetical protein